jgi:hypothetical protein
MRNGILLLKPYPSRGQACTDKKNISVLRLLSLLSDIIIFCKKRPILKSG